MTHAVRLGPFAIADLVALHRWVKQAAGHGAADDYLDRVEARIADLATFPARGTPRDDLSPAMRTLTFERRMIIAYTIDDATVTVLRVINGARDLGTAFPG